MNFKIKILTATLFSALLLSSCTNPIRDKIFYPPKKPLNLNQLSTDAKLIEVITQDNLKLKGIYIPPKEDKPILLVFHGNASGADGILRNMAPIISKGYGIVSAEWRGYSANAGKPSQAGIAKDANAFLEFAKQNAEGRKIIVIGHSLGGGVSLDLSRREKLDMIVTYGTFTGIDAFVPKALRALNEDKFDNFGAVKLLDEPLIIIHAKNDETIPFEHGLILYKAGKVANKDINGIFIDGGSHNFDPAQLLMILEKISNTPNGLKYENSQKFDFEITP